MNNDAFKHTPGDLNNRIWTELLHDLKFFDNDIDDHIMYLRQTFVVGAADWLAGNNGSLQNDKLLFNYSDEEWNYMWTSMMVDGA